MNALNRIVGVVLIAIAAIIGIHTVAEPLYYTSTEAAAYSPLWAYIDPLSAIALILGVIFGYIRLSAAVGDEGALTWERFAANAMFYGFVALSIAFFWNWFIILGGGLNVDAGAVSVVWLTFNALMPPFSVALGIHLLRQGG